MKFISFGCWNMGDPNNKKSPLWHLFKKLDDLKLEDYDFIMITGDNYYEDEEYTPERTQFLMNIGVQRGAGGDKTIDLDAFGKAIKRLKSISNKIPVYICLGNHDWAQHRDHEGNEKTLHQFLIDAIEADKEIPHQCRIIINGSITDSDYPKRDSRAEYNYYVIDTEIIEGGKNHGEDVKASEVDNALAYFTENTSSPIVIFGHVPLLSLSYKESTRDAILKKENKKRRKKSKKLLAPSSAEEGAFLMKVEQKNQKKGSYEPIGNPPDMFQRVWQVSDPLVGWMSEFVRGMGSDKREIIYICADTHNFQEYEIMFSRKGAADRMVRQVVLGSGGTYSMDDLVSPDFQSKKTDVNRRIQRHFERVSDVITGAKLKMAISGLHGIGLFDTSKTDGHFCKFSPYFQDEKDIMIETIDHVLKEASADPPRYYEGMSEENANLLKKWFVKEKQPSIDSLAGLASLKKYKRKRPKKKSKKRKSKKRKSKKRKSKR